jgi:Golgi nucleoside diphosphatase
MKIVQRIDLANGKALSKKVEPGLSSKASNPSEATKYMEPLLKFAVEQLAVMNVTADKHPQIPLYILATAGMRLLPEEKQKEIFNNLRAEIPKTYKFKLAPDQVRTITGQEEALYAWLSYNFLSGTVGTDKKAHTIPVLEMGGASAQIAFQITDEKELDEIVKKSGAKSKDELKDFIYHLDRNVSDCNSAKYQVYARSYLGAGSDAARRTYLSTLLEKVAEDMSKTEVKQDDPCLAVGMKSEVKFQNAQNKEVKVDLTGSWKVDDCQARLKNLINIDVTSCPNGEIQTGDKACPIRKLTESGVEFGDHDVAGLGSFHHQLKDLIAKVGSFNYDKLVDLVKQQCASPAPPSGVFNRRKRSPPKITSKDEHFSKTACFRNFWALTFLTEAAHMPKTFAHFKTLEKVEGQKVAWPLGAILYKTRKEAQECPPEKPKNSAGSLTVNSGLMGLVLVVSLYWMGRGQ